MGGKGGGTTKSTSYTTSLPEYARPYYEELMRQSFAHAQEPYIPYEGPRIAGFTDPQLAMFSGVENLAATGNPALSASTSYANFANSVLAGGAGGLVNPYLGAPTYDPMYYSPDNVATNLWNETWRDQYMSPYIDAVLERTKENAFLDAARQQKLRDAEAVQAGAFGGDRRFVYDALADEALLRNVADIEAKLRQSAYENAQNMFTSDMARRLQSDLANQRAGLDAAQLAEQSRQFGAGLTEQGRQFGSELDYRTQLANEDLRLQALQQLLSGSATLGNLGAMEQAAALERYGALGDIGGQQQALMQDVYGQAYEDFLNQRDYWRNTLSWLSAQLHGVPVSAQSNVIQYQPEPNLLSQILGSGIAGYGLYKSFQ